MNLNDEIDGGQIIGFLQKLIGYIGVIALLIGGIGMYLNLPVIGKVTCLYCPTISGYAYIILAVVSAILVYSNYTKLLYLTGGIAFLLIAYDIFSATTIGYAVQMLLSGGLTPSIGGQMDPVLSSMMQNTELSIPIAWIVIGLGALFLVIAPQVEGKETDKPVQNPREANLQERIRELDKIVEMYKDGDLSKQEFARLKEEILGTNEDK